MLRSDMERFIDEDIGECDDSSGLVPEVEAYAAVIAREECVISGLAEAVQIFQHFGLTAETLYDDGEFVPANSYVLTVQGSSRSILQSERLALNFLARMSGISTLTRRCVLAGGGRVRIAATRKTTPGFRAYERRQSSWAGGTPTGSTSPMQCSSKTITSRFAAWMSASVRPGRGRASQRRLR